jgi:signal peptidase II
MALLTFGCDRVTKHVATAALKGVPPRSYLGDTVRLHYAENPGGFLSLGAELPRFVRILVFDVGTAAILVATIVVVRRQKLPLQVLLAVTLIGAGGASNLVDRAVRGSVVDFLNVGIGGLRTGIFNVADLAITLGVALAVARRTSEAD